MRPLYTPTTRTFKVAFTYDMNKHKFSGLMFTDVNFLTAWFYE